MSSYFDFFCKTNGNNENESSEQIGGICESMCPQMEMDLRIRENMVHVLEVVGDSKKLVKSYSRSAADSNMAVPALLRPYSVLKDTVQYLLLEVLKRQDVSVLVLYDFVNDRLRAVRQDMTIQRLPPEECVCLLDPMIRFYVFYACKLRNYPITDYDPVLNKKYLLESLKWFLYCCDSIDKINGNVGIEELNRGMGRLNVEPTVGYDRALMESIYILSNMEDIHPLQRYLELPGILPLDPNLNRAFKISITNMKGNFVSAWKRIDKLCLLSYCAVFLYIPKIQRRALMTLSHAYSSKQLRVSAAALRRWLRARSDAAALAQCAHYGLHVHGDGVYFHKADFKFDVPLHEIQMDERFEQYFNQHYVDIFTPSK